MGGPEMAPQTPQRSERPGTAGSLLYGRLGQAGARLDTPTHSYPAARARWTSSSCALVNSGRPTEAGARGQPLVLAVAQLAQRASFGTPRRLAVVVDGQRVARRERRPHCVRERDGHAHRGVRQGHERQNVERADAGMDAAMLAHVDLGQRRFGQRDRAGGDGGGLREEREDRAMVIGVGVDVRERDARRGAHGGRDARQARRVAALADVRHALHDEAPRHGGILRGAMPLLPLGKLPGELLQAVLDKHVPRDPRAVVGPRVGEDAAVIDLGDRYLVATADPITFATDDLGWYALLLNSNDIVVRGATPRW